MSQGLMAATFLAELACWPTFLFLFLFVSSEPSEKILESQFDKSSKKNIL